MANVNMSSRSLTIGKHRTLSNKSSAVAEMGDRGHNRHGPKRGGCCAPFAGAGTPSSTMWPGPSLLPYQAASSSIQPFCHNRHKPKIGWDGCALFVGVAGSTSNTICRVGRGLPPYQGASLCIQPFGHNKNGLKIGGYAPFGGGRGSPSNTMRQVSS